MSDSNFALFLGDLSVFCTKEDLVELLAPFGRIVDIRIKQDINTGKKLSYGFVEFDNINSAMAVMNNLNGYVLCGRPLRIRLGASKTAKKVAKCEVAPVETSSVHVSFCLRAMNVVVTEESLRYLFSAYGYVLDATVKKAVCNGMRGANEGYGFVHYDSSSQGVESAFRAVADMNNAIVNGVHYKVSLSASLERRLNDQMNMSQVQYRPQVVVPPAPQQMVYPQQAYYYPAPAPVAAPVAPSTYYRVVPPTSSFYANNQPQIAPYYAAPAAPARPVYPSQQVYRPTPPSIVPEASCPSAFSTPRAADMPVRIRTPATSPRARAVTPVPEAAAASAVAPVDALPVESPVAPAPTVVYEIPLPAAKKLDDDDLISASSGSSVSSIDSPISGLVKVMPALHSETDLQKQLNEARDDCGSCKHSTIDVYMDMQEHLACVDICDY